MKPAKISNSTIIMAILAFVIAVFWLASHLPAGQKDPIATPTTVASVKPTPTKTDGMNTGLQIANMAAEKAIAAALSFYCSSAPTNSAMWLPMGNTGIYQALSLSTGEAFSLMLSPSSKANTTNLQAYDENAQWKLASWGCPSTMPITVVEEDY